ncbi:DMT family transporter [Desulfobacula sp.]|uniref:DMT family transporter n=1 Tax=Desulfobacula sp. TaxID=2593537 RepID=UPI00262A68F6|nr:DMT family transporter [Desulfobacula sp.]
MKTKRFNTVMGVKEWGLIVLLSIIWGASFFFVEIAIKTMTPLTIVLCRVSGAAFLLWGVVLVTRRKLPKDIRVWLAFLVLGAMNNVIPFSLIAWGQSHIDSSLAAILNATTPVFSVVLAHFLTKDEPLTKKRLAGVLFGWVGVIILIGIESLDGFGMKIAGQAAVLCAAFLYAISAIFGRRFKAIDPAVVAAGMLSGSTLIMVPLVAAFEQPFALSPDWTTGAALFGLAVISTALAYIIYFYVLSKAGATNILLVTFLIPVSAIFLGVMVLGETPGWNAFTGMGLIFIGLIFIDGRILERFKK